MSSAPTADPSAPDCCDPSEAAPCSACSAPPDKTRRPKNNTPERLAQIAQGVLIDRVDGAFAAITAACLEELESFLPETDLDLAPLAQSIAIRVVQSSLLVWFPDCFGEDPELVRAGKVEVLKRRAESERRAGRHDLAAHWEEMAGSVSTDAGIIPANGVLQRVSKDGFRLLADRLRGGLAVE